MSARGALLLALAFAACASPSETPEPSGPTVTSREAPRPAPSSALGESTRRSGDPAVERVLADAETEGAVAAIAAMAQAEEDAQQAGRVVAEVAGEELFVDELLTLWLHKDSNSVQETLSELVIAHIIRRDAVARGLKIDPALLDRRLAEVRAELDRTVREGTGGMPTEEWIARGLGLHPGRYLELLRRKTAEQILTERLVRLWFAEQGWARLRMILVEGEDALAEVQAALEAGEDFANVARAKSLDASAEEGGLIPAFVKSELSPMSQLAFLSPLGEVAGPLEMQGRFVLILVEQLHEPRSGGWSVLGPEIEARLVDDLVTAGEYVQWEIFIQRAYSVDLRPFYELVGEPPLE